MAATFLLAGDVADFDEENFRAALLSVFVSATDAVLDVSSGSVVVDAALRFNASAAASAAVATIETTPVDAMQQAWFGAMNITITAPPTAQLRPPVIGMATDAPPPCWWPCGLEDWAKWTLLGVGVFLAVCACALLVCFLRSEHSVGACECCDALIGWLCCSSSDSFNRKRAKTNPSRNPSPKGPMRRPLDLSTALPGARPMDAERLESLGYGSNFTPRGGALSPGRRQTI